MSSFTTSKQLIFPHSYLLHVLLHHIPTLHLPSLLPPACPPSPHPITSSSLTPTSCMSSFTTSKHFIFLHSYLLHVLLHHIQTRHLLSLLPPACPPSPHPNTSSSFTPTSCMSSFTTSKHVIFSRSYFLHVPLHHIQTLHLSSFPPAACPPSPHPDTSSSFTPTSCMSSFTTSKHVIFSRSYFLHVHLHNIQALHRPSLLPHLLKHHIQILPLSFPWQLNLQHLSVQVVIIPTFHMSVPYISLTMTFCPNVSCRNVFQPIVSIDSTQPVPCSSVDYLHNLPSLAALSE